MPCNLTRNDLERFNGGVGWGRVGWGKVIIISNPTSVKVGLRCIDVRFGELKIISPVLGENLSSLNFP